MQSSDGSAILRLLSFVVAILGIIATIALTWAYPGVHYANPVGGAKLGQFCWYLMWTLFASGGLYGLSCLLSAREG